MKVPLIDLRAQHASIAATVEAAVKRVLESGHYILGEDVAAFERELAAATGRAHAVAVSSGTDALLAALMALGVGPGDEVVTTPLSFFATAGAIVRLGARPVFADIDPRSFNLDAGAALARVTDKTRAILPVHLFGRACDLQPLRNTGVPIIEDAAQGIGLSSLGRGTLCATLSFFPSKNLGAAGDAGALICDDADFADRLRLLRAHGSRPKYVHHVVGGNFRIDTLQAAILRAKLPHLTAWNTARRRNADRYLTLLADTPLTLPDPTQPHVWHHFVIRVPNGKRDALRAHLASREIETEVYYPTPLHLQPCFANL
ncbi:MAG TPA: DegT/DnrJ/EryC1/StrS family aminotransferase, partial [Polyangia bacterium]